MNIHKSSSLILFLTILTIHSTYAYKPEDLERLHAGSCLGGDLREADLRTIPLRGKSIKGAILSGANVEGVDFTDVDTYNADFREVALTTAQKDQIRTSNPLFEYYGRADTFIRGGAPIFIRGNYPYSNINVYKSLASRKDAEGALYSFITAYLYETFGSFADEGRSLMYYQQAIDAGSPEAANNLGWMVENGRGVITRNHNTALEFYRDYKAENPIAQFNYIRSKAMYKNSPVEQFALAGLLNRQRDSYSHDLIQWWYETAALNGHALSAYTVAHRYDKGEGTLKSQRKAIEWLQKASDLDKEEGKASYELGSRYLWGDTVWGRSGLAYKLYVKAAEMDHEAAQKRLAFMYSLGFDTEYNPKRALFWSEILSTKGSISAIFNTAHLWEYFKAREGALEKAKYCYDKLLATASNHAGALVNLSRFYEYGWGVPIDLAAAESLLTDACSIEGAARHMAGIFKLSKLQSFLPPPMMDFNDPALLRAEQARLMTTAQANAVTLMETNPLLREIYEQAGALLGALIRPDSSGVRINQDQLVTDPYEAHHKINYGSELDIPPAAITTSIESLKTAYGDPYYKDKFYYSSEQLSRMNTYFSVLQGSEDRLLHQKFSWWVRRYTSPEVISREVVESTEEQKLLVQRGHLLSKLISFFHEEISEGMEMTPNHITKLFHRFFDQDNWKAVYYTAPAESLRAAAGSGAAAGRPSPDDYALGIGISKVIQNYKKQYLGLHRTEVPMVEDYPAIGFALGIEGAIGTVSPLERENSEETIKTFIKGGEVERQGQKYTVEPYIPSYLVKLLQRALYNPRDPNVTVFLFNEFVFHNEFLRNKYEEASLGERGRNEYFDPFAEDLRPGVVGADTFQACYLPKTFEYILQQYGYLI